MTGKRGSVLLGANEAAAYSGVICRKPLLEHATPLRRKSISPTSDERYRPAPCPLGALDCLPNARETAHRTQF